MKRSFEIDNITPEELASVFLEFVGYQQAAFFNAFKAKTDEWGGAGWCQQCCSISRHLDAAGIETIAKLAEWAADPYVPDTGENGMIKASTATAQQLVACYRSGQIDVGTMVRICRDRPDVRAIFDEVPE